MHVYSVIFCATSIQKILIIYRQARNPRQGSFQTPPPPYLPPINEAARPVPNETHRPRSNEHPAARSRGTLRSDEHSGYTGRGAKEIKKEVEEQTASKETSKTRKVQIKRESVAGPSDSVNIKENQSPNIKEESGTEGHSKETFETRKFQIKKEDIAGPKDPASIEAKQTQKIKEETGTEGHTASKGPSKSRQLQSKRATDPGPSSSTRMESSLTQSIKKEPGTKGARASKEQEKSRKEVIHKVQTGIETISLLTPPRSRGRY